MPDSYTDVFGGQNRSPAQLSYVSYIIDASIELQWPFNAADGAYIAAAKLDIVASTGGLTVKLPPANSVTVGQDILIRNRGSNSFTVIDQQSNTIVTVASGIEWFLWVTKSLDAAGEWGTVQFGAGVSAANAAALAGAGLRANVTVLDQHLATTSLGGNHTVTQADRATVLMNTGGVVTHTFPLASDLGNGWFVYEINAGSGTVTLTPTGGNTIDGAGTKVLQPGENCIVFSDGSNLHTLGYGRTLVNTITGAAINLAPGGTKTLSSTEVKAQVHDFSGALLSNSTVEYGVGVGYWFVKNGTTGAFTVTARTNAFDPGVVIPQGNFTIIRSNGTNVNIAFTATTGTVTSVGTTAGELTGGPITSTGTIGLANTTVAAGTYGTATAIPVITVDAKGRITDASTSVALGTAAVEDVGTAPGDIPVLAVTLTPTVGMLAPEQGGVPTGAIFDIVVDLPAGYIYLTGSIGDALSGASNRANADTHNLFLAMWSRVPSGNLAPAGKGATAEDDWLAHKRLTMFDARGRVRAGRDNMLGSAAGLITAPWVTPDGDTIGATGGQQNETATFSASGTSDGVGPPANVQTGDDGGSFRQADGSAVQVAEHPHTHDIVAGSISVSGSASVSGTTDVATNLPPVLIVDVIVKL